MDDNIVLGLGVIVATLFGPVLAVMVTRWHDNASRVRERRLEIFRILMATRRTILSPERVRALNLVEIDFYGKKGVEEAHREVMKHINTSAQLNPQKWNDQLRSLITRLLSEMAKVLGYSLQQLDVLEGGYHPQGFVDIELEQQTLRRVLIQVFSGNRPLSVSPAVQSPPSPFPPPPAPDPLVSTPPVATSGESQ